MSFLDHQAILRAKPAITTIDDSFGNYGLDKDGNKVYFTQAEVDAARVVLNSEMAAVKYRSDRVGNPSKRETDTTYLPVGDQLDLLYKDILAGKLNSTGEFAAAIKATKDKYPKS